MKEKKGVEKVNLVLKWTHLKLKKMHDLLSYDDIERVMQYYKKTREDYDKQILPYHSTKKPEDSEEQMTMF